MILGRISNDYFANNFAWIAAHLRDRRDPILLYSGKIPDSYFMSDFRLGDVIDDHCIKCRRVTNHAIVSLVNSEPAKVRCRTCYNDHDYRHEQAPPSKKDLKKADLFKEVLSAVAPAAAADTADSEEEPAKPEAKVKARSKKA
jgi:hypothetical protein